MPGRRGSEQDAALSDLNCAMLRCWVYSPATSQGERRTDQMTSQKNVRSLSDHQDMIDRLYEVALNPDALESFIENWQDNAQATFDADFHSHLERADQFLQIGERVTGDANAALTPYRNFAAFVLDENFHIDACNAAASEAFAIRSGQHIDQLDVSPENLAKLQSWAADMLSGASGTIASLSTVPRDAQGSMLFRFQKISGVDGRTRVLVVSTQFRWRDTTAALLETTFDLSRAEQEITRRLTEGGDIKDIARDRGTSIETVRSQIKAIMRKLNARSQTEIVRFCMALAAVEDASSHDANKAKSTSLAISSSALEQEFWKPFGQVLLPDGRRLTYHDMGPPNGHPILVTHMGSCMVRWSRKMLRLAFLNNLRIICPIRAGFGSSDPLAPGADVLAQGCADMAYLLEQLEVLSLPFVAQGSDFPFATAFAARYPHMTSEIIAVGGKPCLPGGANIEGRGMWQRFFAAAAMHNPKLLAFASNAVMAMSRRMSAEDMLKRLCKESPSDLACLDIPDIKEALVANIDFMAQGSPNIGRAFAAEFRASQTDWSADVIRSKPLPIRVFVAQEDPTIDLSQLHLLQEAYPWIDFQVIEKAGLALMFQHYEELIPEFSRAAVNARYSVN